MSHRITLSLPDDLYNYLHQRSVSEGRTKANLIIYLMRTAITTSHQPAAQASASPLHNEVHSGATSSTKTPWPLPETVTSDAAYTPPADWKSYYRMRGPAPEPPLPSFVEDEEGTTVEVDEAKKTVWLS